MDVTRAPNLANAFDIIKTYDPDLYQRMNNSPWLVTGDQEDEIKGKGFGVTGLADDGTWVSEIDPDSINQFVDMTGAPGDAFAADVLAHEFAHTTFGGAPLEHVRSHDPKQVEPRAFDAGTAFARKLPSYMGRDAIIWLSEQTKQDVMKKGYDI